MEKIKKFLKGLWTFLNSRLFVVALLSLLLLFLVNTCSNLREERRENIIHENNEKTLTDSIQILKNKNGELEATKTILIASEKELKELNKKLYDDVNAEKGQVISLNNIVFQLKQDKNLLESHISYLESLMGKPIQTNDSTYIIPWTLRYNWDKNPSDSLNYDIYKGETRVGIFANENFIWKDGLTNDQLLRDAFSLKHYSTYLTERTTQIKLTFGEKIVDGKFNVFVSTEYPGFNPKSLEGVFIDPNTNPNIKKLMKKKQFFPGTWSLGAGPSVGYNILTAKPYFGVGVNLNYTIFQF